MSDTELSVQSIAFIFIQNDFINEILATIEIQLIVNDRER